MALAQTKAASYIQEHCEEISSHQVISLLMDGALERAGQAITAFDKNQKEDLSILVSKLVAIINGLKNCLDMNAGGEIAENLDALYFYMVEKITQADEQNLKSVLEETRTLIEEVKTGWDSMSLSEVKVPEVAC